MRGDGIAGALWLLGRQAELIWQRASVGIAFLMIIAPAFCAPQAQATIITATITGTVTSGYDTDGDVFGLTNLDGQNFTLVYTIDDTKGVSTSEGTPPYFSQINSRCGIAGTRAAVGLHRDTAE